MPSQQDTPTPPAAPVGSAAQIERLVGALQDPTRRGILLSFYDDPSARTVDEVATAAGVHRTVAFGHLERLAAQGFLEISQRRGVPGKPANLYALGAGPLELHHPARQFAILAGLLAGGLEHFGAAGSQVAREAGRKHAAILCSAAPGGGAADIEQALRPLAVLGGSYAVEGDRVLARNCIFREACASAPQVVCQLHAGMIEGALEAAGRPGRVEPIGATDAAPCVYRLGGAAARRAPATA
jgi:predicted ArsR family transcriptional regulator